MFNKIFQSIKSLVRRLLRSRTRKTGDNIRPDPYSESQVPVRESSADSSQNVYESTMSSIMPDDATDVRPQEKSSVATSGEDESDRRDYQSASDSQAAGDGQDSSFDQPTSNDNESIESTSGTDSNQSDHVLRETEPVTPNSGGSEKSPSETPEDRLLGSDSLPPQPVEGDQARPLSNVDIGGSSQSDLTDMPPAPPKKNKLSEVNALDENSDSLEGKEKKPKPKVPSQIGGKRNGPTQPPSPAKGPRDKPTLPPRPELICRKFVGSWQWEVILSADEECNIKEVLHSGAPLKMMDGEYRLSSFRGSLSIEYADREPEEFPLFDRTPLIFKLRNNWDGDGRKVGGITSGYFIVIAPREWKRTGSAPVEQARCVDADFTAHYFSVTKDGSAKDVSGFEGCELTLTKSGFDLTGEGVFDDSEDGELFVGTAPKLIPASGVVWARSGEEKKGGWKGENFKPDGRSLAEVLNGRQGRFFVRVYDAEPKLLDSGEFRYLRDLREIQVNGESYSANTLLVPPSTGHPETKLQFVDAGGATIRPKLETLSPYATVQPQGTVVVKPHIDGDLISCALGSGAGSVDIVIRLPRIWWRMGGQDKGSPDKWRDAPLTMSRQQFREHANGEKTMRLRLPHRIASITVGFDDELDRKYAPPKRGEDTEIPLADFVDYSQIDQRLNENVSLNVQCGGEVMALILVPADPIPVIVSFTSEPAVVPAGGAATLHWVTQNAKSYGVAIDPEIGSVGSSGSVTITPDKTTTFTLRLTTPGLGDVTEVVTVNVLPELHAKTVPQVRGARGSLRRGKGFSRSELHAAGLTDEGIMRRSVPVDRRRRSTHQANIDTIKRSINV